MQFGLIQRIKNIFRLPTKPQSVTVSATPKLYRSIHDLPLTIFIDCQCEQKYDGLILQGNPTESELSETWADLLQQYAELIGGKDVMVKVDDTRKLLRSECRLTRIDNLLFMINTMPCEAFYNSLFSFGYKMQKPPFSFDNFKKVLKLFLGYYNLEKTKYKILAARREANNAKKNEHQTNRNDFTKVLGRVAIAFKMPPISISTITTAQYCNFVLEYQAHCENIEKESQKNSK